MQEQFKAEFVFDVDLSDTKIYTGSATDCLEQFTNDLHNDVIPDFVRLISPYSG